MEKMDLERLITQPTWKELLLDLVTEEKLDPWNIDIVEITDKYIKQIKRLQTLDLRIPANLVLAASILLRFKSDALRFEEEETVVQEEIFIEEEKPPIEIPMLSLRTRVPPKRKVTLEELVKALESVFEDIKRRRESAPPPKKKITIKVPEYDISERMNTLLTKAQKLADKNGLLTFSALLDEKTPEKIIFTLLPLLHLAQKEKLLLIQKEFFEEIFIQLCKT